MKKLIAVMALSMAMNAGAAFAAEEENTGFHPLQHIESARLTDFNVDSRSGLPIHPYGGSITVNYTKQTATLFLDTCPTGAMCLIGGPSFTLPIVSQFTDRCGLRHIKAEANHLMVDGDHKILSIIDFTGNTCRMMIPAPTTASLRIIGAARGGSLETLSTFKGEKFELMMMAQ